MGRKPNALILQHFERGPKLNDSSNRYQHTCKACGEKFPKGRIDSLTTHLIKKCQAMSTEARQKALLELNNLPHLSSGSGSQPRNGEVQLNGPTVELPIGNSNWTALETLAEVSRQIDLSEKHDDRSVNNKSAGGVSESHRTDRLELQEQYTLDNPPVSYEQRVQREKKQLQQQLGKTNRRESETSLPPVNFAPIPSSRSMSPNLAMAASSMAAAAAASARFAPSMVDPQLLGEDLNAQMNIPTKTIEQEISEANAALSQDFYTSDHQNTWPMLDGTPGNMYPETTLEQSIQTAELSRTSTYPRIAMNPMTTEFSAEYGNGQKPNKPKVRGRFTPSRRKEVQAVRKLGACIRCRVLRKPCSDGTPCDTCKNVESARVWKQPCSRTKIAEDFQMYSAGLHVVLAHHEVNATKSRALFRSSPHQIEASHYPETTVYATFNGLEGQVIPVEGNIDPGLSGDFSTNTLRILDSDNDDLPMKLEAYMKRISGVFFAREPSHFMNTTLILAQQLAVEKADVLLESALELWSIVHILVDHELRWTISERIDIDAPAGHGTAISPNSGDGTYNLLGLQLNAAAEKKASVICKHVLSQLERRLLERVSPANSFETFLIVIIILNCVEKSTWLFKSWEQESFKARWPLDKNPIWFASQGEHLTDMLQMLLRMRNVPPKIYIRDDGVLATDSDPVAHDYFESVQLRHVDVVLQQDKHVFNQADSRCYELRFCSKILLPVKA